MACGAVARFDQDLAVDGEGERAPHRRIGQEGMRVGAVEVERALVRAETRIVAGLVDQQALHLGAEAGHHDALAGGGHLREHLGLHLQIPGVIELAGLEHGARGGRGVAAALEGGGRERRLVCLTVVLVGGVGDHVVGAELLDLEGPVPMGPKFCSVHSCALAPVQSWNCAFCRMGEVEPTKGP